MIFKNLVYPIGGPPDNAVMSPPLDPDIQAAAKAGFDLNLMDINLSLPPEERWRQHDMALQIILELEEARMNFDAGFQSTPPPSR